MMFSLGQIVRSCKHWLDFDGRRRELYSYWEEQAAQGDEQAAYRLAALYPASYENYPLAFKWTQMLANKGEDCRILLQLARMLETGSGVEPDERRALLWYERAISLHIMQGSDSPFSVEEENFVQQRILVLREQTQAE